MPRQNRVSSGSRPRMGNLGRVKAVTLKSRTNASAVPVRSSILHGCKSDFAAQVFRWDSTVDGFLFLETMSSTSSDFEMTFDSEDAEMYFIAEDVK